MTTALGIDLGGSSVKYVVVSAAGELRYEGNLPFAVDRPMEWAEKIRAMVQALPGQLGHAVDVIGLSAPGLARRDGRAIAFMPGRLEGLEGLNWTDYLSAPRPVPVWNDAHAALLGEVWLGAARGFQNVILLTLGTGVGGAAMVDGQLLRGAIGRAGHLGHLSLNPDGPLDITNTPGSLELAIGTCTVAERSQGRFQTTHELITAHQAGDAQATAVWRKSVKALAAAIASFINILDPEAVILGGGIAKAGPVLFEPLEEFLAPIEWRPGGHRAQLLPAQLGDVAGAFGAARSALDAVRV